MSTRRYFAGKGHKISNECPWEFRIFKCVHCGNHRYMTEEKDGRCKNCYKEETPKQQPPKDDSDPSETKPASEGSLDTVSDTASNLDPNISDRGSSGGGL